MACGFTREPHACHKMALSADEVNQLITHVGAAKKALTRLAQSQVIKDALAAVEDVADV
jgi:hypothetical protein